MIYKTALFILNLEHLIIGFSLNNGSAPFCYIEFILLAIW